MTNIIVDVQKLPHAVNLPLPAPATIMAAGVDLLAALDQNFTLNPGTRKIIPTGIAIALPAGYEAQIRPRSGLAANHGVTLLNSPGTIDADYRGELFVLMTWIGEGESYKVKSGERIAQLVIAPIPDVQFAEVEVADLGDTERGEGGFGSTGRF